MGIMGVIMFACAFCSLAMAKPEWDPLAEIDSIYPEEQCVKQGGQCVKEADCPHVTAIKGLCPKQRGQGVECCYGISEKETRCRKRGGECVAPNYCSPSLIYRATDCSEDTACCILVN